MLRPEPVSYRYCTLTDMTQYICVRRERKLVLRRRIGLKKKLHVVVIFNFTEQNGASFSKKAQVRQSNAPPL